MEINAIVLNVFIGMGAGLLYAFIGWAKGTDLEKFDGQKFFTTLVIGLIVGGVSGYMNIELTEALKLIAALGLVVVIENVCKFVYRRITDAMNKKIETDASVKSAKKGAKKALKDKKASKKAELPGADDEEDIKVKKDDDEEKKDEEEE